MLRLYRLLLPIVLTLLSPYFLIQAFRYGKYRSGFRQRLGFGLPDTSQPHPRIWIHAVSVGEVLAMEPLIRKLAETYPAAGLFVSTTTETGQEIARARLAGLAEVFFFPLDLSGCVRRTLDRIQPGMVILAETEIWPNFIDEAETDQIPIYLVNARLSDRSYGRYRLISGFMAGLINRLTLIMAQTEADKERFLGLGCDRERLVVTGNLKFDAPLPPAPALLSLDWLGKTAQDRGRLIWIAGSTTPGEEPILLKAFEILRREHTTADLLLVLAPRHPHRFDEVAALLREMKLPFLRRTEAPPAAGTPIADVLLLDTMGELAGLYPLADLVFVGGSLTPFGGHNILEPARFAKPIIVGPHTENFRGILEVFLAEHAVIQLAGTSADEQVVALADLAGRLIRNEAERARLGARARACVDRCRGATDRILGLLLLPVEALLNSGVKVRARRIQAGQSSTHP